jgi:hypothetical protein
MKHEAQHLALQSCLNSTSIRDTRGLENSTLSSSRWMLMVLARACCGPSVVQVPWPQLSTEGESRPFDITWKGLVQPSSSLITSESIPRTFSSPWGFDSRGCEKIWTCRTSFHGTTLPTSEASSKTDHHKDTFRFLINASVNAHGFTIVERLVIHSHRVEAALIPYVMTPSLCLHTKQKCNFFFLKKDNKVTITAK